jgi:hypothetical protein
MYLTQTLIEPQCELLVTFIHRGVLATVKPVLKLQWDGASPTCTDLCWSRTRLQNDPPLAIGSTHVHLYARVQTHAQTEAHSTSDTPCHVHRLEHSGFLKRLLCKTLEQKNWQGGLIPYLALENQNILLSISISLSQVYCAQTHACQVQNPAHLIQDVSWLGPVSGLISLAAQVGQQ